MKNVLLITNIAPQDKSGAGTLGNMHCRMVNSIEGLNVYSVYITDKQVNTNDHVKRIQNSSRWEKVSSVVCGFAPDLNRRARECIFKTIQKKSVSIVYIDNSVNGKLIQDIKHRFPNVAVIAFFHDIESVKMKEDKDNSLFRRLSLPVYLKNERLTAACADKNIVLNERDKRLFEKEFEKEPDAIVPIIIPDVGELPLDKKHTANAKLKILFVGVEYGPNLDGIRWFLKNVIPYIKCDFEFNVVGYRMEKYRAEFEQGHDNVHVIGTVDSLKEWYVDSDLIVAPIFEGGGMKVKTAEALSYGKHFVGCSESLEGYWEGIPDSLRNHKIFKCDVPEEFAEAIDEIAGREFYVNDKEIKEWADSNYSYQANFARYKKIFEDVMK
jgi:hypothetical protein